jgi:hypothetical protein
LFGSAAIKLTVAKMKRKERKKKKRRGAELT